MSSMLNHPTTERFYAYFICISLTAKAYGQMADESEGVETDKKKKIGKKTSSLSDDNLQRSVLDSDNLPICLFQNDFMKK